MAIQGQNEGFRVLDDFVCEAILAPSSPHAVPTKHGQNEGMRVVEEIVFDATGGKPVAKPTLQDGLLLCLLANQVRWAGQQLNILADNLKDETRPNDSSGVASRFRDLEALIATLDHWQQALKFVACLDVQSREGARKFGELTHTLKQRVTSRMPPDQAKDDAVVVVHKCLTDASDEFLLLSRVLIGEVEAAGREPAPRSSSDMT